MVNFQFKSISEADAGGVLKKKKGVLRNFAKFTGKHLCLIIFFDSVAGVSLATLLKKILQHRCFPKNLEKFLRTPFLQNTSERLLQQFSTTGYVAFGISNYKKNACHKTWT